MPCHDLNECLGALNLEIMSENVKIVTWPRKSTPEAFSFGQVIARQDHTRKRSTSPTATTAGTLVNSTIVATRSAVSVPLRNTSRKITWPPVWLAMPLTALRSSRRPHLPAPTSDVSIAVDHTPPTTNPVRDEKLRPKGSGIRRVNSNSLQINQSLTRLFTLADNRLRREEGPLHPSKRRHLEDRLTTPLNHNQAGRSSIQDMEIDEPTQLLPLDLHPREHRLANNSAVLRAPTDFTYPETLNGRDFFVNFR